MSGETGDDQQAPAASTLFRWTTATTGEQFGEKQFRRSFEVDLILLNFTVPLI
uniref:Uncharacterized protein n=1 Tax=Solanum lycopersicum TaxID=4081 RepID=K4AVM9_SOLLC